MNSVIAEKHFNLQNYTNSEKRTHDKVYILKVCIWSRKQTKLKIPTSDYFNGLISVYDLTSS